MVLSQIASTCFSYVNILSILSILGCLYFSQLIPNVLYTPTNYWFSDKVLKLLLHGAISDSLHLLIICKYFEHFVNFRFFVFFSTDT